VHIVEREVKTMAFLKRRRKEPYQDITVQYLKLLGVESLPGLPEHESFFIQSTEELLREHGEEWVREAGPELVSEWEYLVEGFL
jgi:hypothetical protein